MRKEINGQLTAKSCRTLTFKVSGLHKVFFLNHDPTNLKEYNMLMFKQQTYIENKLVQAGSTHARLSNKAAEWSLVVRYGIGVLIRLPFFSDTNCANI